MKEEFQVEKEISIVEIFKALISKILYLILALILGAAAGGVYGYFTSKDVVIYGTKIDFYVNPVPDEQTGADGESIYANYGSYSSNVMTNVVKLLESQMFSSKILDGLMGVDEKGDAISGKQPAIAGLPEKKYNQDGSLNYTYKNWLKTVSSAVNFSFKADGSIAESFIYVSLNMNQDVNGGKGKDTITAICDEVMIVVPEFISKNMPVPSKYKGTSCEATTLVTDIVPTNGTYASSQTTKLAIIAGVIALVIAAAIVIVLHMSDKRLRDVDVLPKAFNLPLLGVIPTIDEGAMKHYEDNKGGKA